VHGEFLTILNSLQKPFEVFLIGINKKVSWPKKFFPSGKVSLYF
jgi:hypothetical protein